MKDIIHFPNKGHIYMIALCRRPTPGLYDSTADQEAVTCPECRRLLPDFNSRRDASRERKTMPYQKLIISKAISEAKRVVPEIEHEMPKARPLPANRPRFVHRGRNDGVSGPGQIRRARECDE